MSTSPLVCIGVITSAHGVRGQVKVHSYTEDPETLFSFGSLFNKNGSKSYTLTPQGGGNDAVFIASIKGINNRNEAEKLHGTELYISRDLLPDTEEEEFYYTDLIGLKVVQNDGNVFGTVKAIQNYGADDIIEITLADSTKTTLLPFTKAIFPDIRLSEGIITFTPPDVLIAKEGHE